MTPNLSLHPTCASLRLSHAGELKRSADMSSAAAWRMIL